MKKTMIHFLIALSMLPAFAQQQPQQNGQNGMGGAVAQADAYNEACEGKNAVTAGQRRPTDPKAVPVKMPLTTCEKLEYVSYINKSTLVGADMKSTVDGRATCYKRGGYTVDYKDCKLARDLYNAVIVAEQAMFATQKVMITESNIKQTNEVNKKTAEGKGQEAAMQAIKDRNEQNSKMFKQQARLYTGAVGAMVTGVSAWKAKGKGALRRLCKNNAEINKQFEASSGYAVQPGECESIIDSHIGTFYSNDDAKTFFITQAGLFFQKAAEASRMAKLNEEVAQTIGETPPDQTQDEILWDKCQVDPNLPECKSRGPRSPTTTTFNGPGMNFGAGGGGQTFDMGAGGDGSFGDTGAATDFKPGDDKITDVNNPFQDELSKAKGILDPAAAAQVGPGGGGAGGGVAGGGGGGGGGSASLGDDLEGADAEGNKENEIKTNALSGTYKPGGGGGGFAAVKGGKDENPFASLFGDKGEGSGGGVEEDRSIASEIDGGASGLFEKISRKYGQVQKEKRVESQNLE